MSVGPARPAAEQVLHASCVALDGRGLLILGAAGSGKSALALALMAFGARLVADDRTELFRRGEAVIARAPTAIAGLIEARGLGILRAEAAAEASLAAAVDLDARVQERLPQPHRIALLGCDLPLLHGPATPTLPAALLQYLKGGRHA